MAITLQSRLAAQLIGLYHTRCLHIKVAKYEISQLFGGTNTGERSQGSQLINRHIAVILSEYLLCIKSRGRKQEHALFV